MRRGAALCIALALCLSLCACSPSPRQRASFALDTLCAVTVYSGRDEACLDEALAQIDRWEAQLSRHIDGSPVDRLNREGGGETDEALLEVIRLAQQVWELSGGAFDAALGNLSDLWGFGTDEMQVPKQAQIDEARAHSGMEKVSVSGTRVTVADGAALDLGGVAKGYIAQQVADFLRTQGVQSAIVNLGGNVVLVGGRPGGGPFTVGIQAPLSVGGTLIATVAAQDCAVVTSGVYQRYFEQDGVLYHHVLDPKTGWPAETDLLSATVLCQDAAYADALSTALLVLGKQAGTALAESLPGVEAIFVDTQSHVTYTGGLEGKVEVLY